MKIELDLTKYQIQDLIGYFSDKVKIMDRRIPYTYNEVVSYMHMINYLKEQLINFGDS
jgi:hypothetical protein